MEKKSVLKTVFRRGWFILFVTAAMLCAVLLKLGRERAFLPTGELTWIMVTLGGEDVTDRIPEEELMEVLAEVRLRGLPIDNGSRGLDGTITAGNRFHAASDVLEVSLAVGGNPLHLRLSPKDGYYAYESGEWLRPVLDGAAVYDRLLALIE